jgi:hypothetical protein
MLGVGRAARGNRVEASLIYYCEEADASSCKPYQPVCTRYSSLLTAFHARKRVSFERWKRAFSIVTSGISAF